MFNCGVLYCSISSYGLLVLKNCDFLLNSNVLLYCFANFTLWHSLPPNWTASFVFFLILCVDRSTTKIEVSKNILLRIMSCNCLSSWSVIWSYVVPISYYICFVLMRFDLAKETPWTRPVRLQYDQTTNRLSFVLMSSYLSIAFV